MNLLISISAFILAIGLLVAIHEYGHFWVARKLGVKVLRYSIGFGKPLWTRVSGEDNIEYVVSAIPLGGYVKMLDEREGEVAEHELHRAFNRQSVWTRIAVVIAGPMANFLLAIVLFAMTFMLGTTAYTPFVGEITPKSPASVAGMTSGGVITAVNGEPVNSWDETRMTLLNGYLENKSQVNISIESEDNGLRRYSLDLSHADLLKGSQDFLAKAGIEFWHPKQKVTVAQVLPDSSAKAGGLQKNDVLLRVDGVDVTSGRAFIDYIRTHPLEKIGLLVERNAEPVSVSITLAEKMDKGKAIGSLGAMLSTSVAETASAETQKKLDKYAFIYQRNPWDALVLGVHKTWQMSVVTLKVMGRLITGKASLKNISGPITIAEFAGKTAVMGLTVYLGFLAIISVSLGVLNLLPIPMLDGGHLLYYIIELFRGKPVSERVEAVGFQIGIALVGTMMMLALYNDVMRLVS